jgi:hypothetical protein
LFAIKRAITEASSRVPTSIQFATRTSVLVAIVLLSGGGSFGQALVQARLVAQGEYSAVDQKDSQTRTVQLDHWQMYAMKDGSYLVSAQILPRVTDLYSNERNLLTKDLQPAAFKVTVSGDNRLRKGVETSCHYGATEIVCDGVLNGVSSSAALAAKKPYVFIPAMEAAASEDIPWFYQNMLSQVPHSVGEGAVVSVISLGDNSNKGITLTIHETDEVTYLGKEDIQILNRVISAHKFSLKESSGGPPEYMWMSESGILLRALSGPSVVLTKYQGPPL